MRSRRTIAYATLALLACAIVAFALVYSHMMVQTLRSEEARRMQVWAEATQLLVECENADSQTIEFLFGIIKQNTSIPVVVCDTAGVVVSHRNLAEADSLLTEAQLQDVLSHMKEKGYSMPIVVDGRVEQYLYYSDSRKLDILRYYPYTQLGLIVLFVLFAYVLFSRARKTERENIWIGLARETAHQLGTPITALVGWQQTLAENPEEASDVAAEMQKDIIRLRNIADRFQKIGTPGAFEHASLRKTIERTTDYLRSRTPRRVAIDFEDGPDVVALHNPTLIGWAVENIMRNSVDAIDGPGRITLAVRQTRGKAVITVADTGRGMTKRQASAVFKAGYTTKRRGWGIGLALAKRIVCQYHRGSICVAKSKPGVGTTVEIRIRV